MTIVYVQCTNPACYSLYNTKIEAFKEVLGEK